MRYVFQTLAVATALAIAAGLHTVDNEKDHDKKTQKVGVHSSGTMTRKTRDPDVSFHCTRDHPPDSFLDRSRREAIGRSAGGTMIRRELQPVDPEAADEPSDLDNGLDQQSGGDSTNDDSDDVDTDADTEEIGAASHPEDHPEDDSEETSDGREDADETHTLGTGLDGDDDNPAIPTTGKDGCTEDYTIDGNWCEETCSDPDGPLSVAIELCAGTCNEKGFVVGKGVLKVAWFAKDSSPLPRAGQFVVTPGCDAYHVVKHGMCEAFCVTESNKHFAQTRTGVVKMSCADAGYDKFVMHGQVTFNVMA